MCERVCRQINQVSARQTLAGFAVASVGDVQLSDNTSVRPIDYIVPAPNTLRLFPNRMHWFSGIDRL